MKLMLSTAIPTTHQRYLAVAEESGGGQPAVLEDISANPSAWAGVRVGDDGEELPATSSSELPFGSGGDDPASVHKAGGQQPDNGDDVQPLRIHPQHPVEHWGGARTAPRHPDPTRRPSHSSDSGDLTRKISRSTAIILGDQKACATFVDPGNG